LDDIRTIFRDIPKNNIHKIFISPHFSSMASTILSHIAPNYHPHPTNEMNMDWLIREMNHLMMRFVEIENVKKCIHFQEITPPGIQFYPATKSVHVYRQGNSYLILLSVSFFLFHALSIFEKRNLRYNFE